MSRYVVERNSLFYFYWYHFMVILYALHHRFISCDVSSLIGLLVRLYRNVKLARFRGFELDFGAHGEMK